MSLERVLMWKYRNYEHHAQSNQTNKQGNKIIWTEMKKEGH